MGGDATVAFGPFDRVTFPVAETFSIVDSFRTFRDAYTSWYQTAAGTVTSLFSASFVIPTKMGIEIAAVHRIRINPLVNGFVANTHCFAVWIINGQPAGDLRWRPVLCEFALHIVD